MFIHRAQKKALDPFGKKLQIFKFNRKIRRKKHTLKYIPDNSVSATFVCIGRNHKISNSIHTTAQHDCGLATHCRTKY